MVSRTGIVVADVVALPFVWAAAHVMRIVRRAGLGRLPRTRGLLVGIGVLPIRNHYYEPQFDFRATPVDFSLERDLPGITWNMDAQLSLLEQLTWADELTGIPSRPSLDVQVPTFTFGNDQFGRGDAELLYQMVRRFEPSRIFEIGSGNSTLMAARAVARNVADDPAYSCRHVCVEPYEMPWLERVGVEVQRTKVEDIDLTFFEELGPNDILFIDSSHIIRPHGDVLVEYLQILPRLAPGVIVHVHDIFTPRNYKREWIVDDLRLWNEQYLLEAFLTSNESWEILVALNLLAHRHLDRVRAVAPYLTAEDEPGSFWMRRR